MANYFNPNSPCFYYDFIDDFDCWTDDLMLYWEFLDWDLDF